MMPSGAIAEVFVIWQDASLMEALDDSPMFGPTTVATKQRSHARFDDKAKIAGTTT
jgi:hypothetical protein